MQLKTEYVTIYISFKSQDIEEEILKPESVKKKLISSWHTFRSSNDFGEKNSKAVSVF